MLLQGAALLTMPIVHGLKPWIGTAVLLGLGTAMVYPTLLAAVGDVAHPSWRATSVGIYRFWRDLGYALGALLAGVLADLFGMSTALAAIGALTAGSGVLVAVRMPETLLARQVRTAE
jgi:MFS family permease